jgi:hypothetical protein
MTDVPHPYLAAAMGVAILGFGTLWAALRSGLERLPVGCLEVTPVLFLVAVASWVYLPLVLGVPPTTGDNGFHLLKMMETSDFLQGHRLLGWSDMEGAGFPHNVNYPAAGALFGALIHRIFNIGWERAYAWTLLLQVHSVVLALYFAARLHYSRFAGLIAGLLGLLDPGGWWVGGHFSDIEVGMWIQSFSTSFLIAGLALWPVAVERPSARLVATSGVLLGFAVLFHPQAAVLGAAGGFLMLLMLIDARRIPLRQIATGSAAIAGIAFAVSALWLVQYAAAQPFAQNMAGPPSTSDEMWRHVTDGTLLRVPAMWFGAGLIGVLILFRRRDPFSRFAALVSISFPVVFTVETLNLFHLRVPEGTHNLADRLQLYRVYYLMRALGMVAAAAVLAPALVGALRPRRRVGSRWRSLPLRLWLAGVLGLLLQLPGIHIPGWPEKPSPQALAGDDLAQMNQALDAAAKLVTPEDRLVLRNQAAIDHSLVFATVLRGLKTQVIGGDAAGTFKNRFSTDNLSILQRVGASALLSRGDLPDSLRDLEKVGTFGPFELRKIPRLSRAWIIGAGSVEVLSWADEEIHLRVSGTNSKSWVGLGLGYYPAWQSASGDLPRAIRSGATPFCEQEEARFSAFPASDGEMVLRYHRPAAERVGLAISVLSLAAFIAFELWRRKASRRPSNQEVPGPTLDAREVPTQAQ